MTITGCQHVLRHAERLLSYHLDGVRRGEAVSVTDVRTMADEIVKYAVAYETLRREAEAAVITERAA